jgi:uncharacterized membrane protein YfhO
VLNMLHTKYIIGTGQQGETQVQVNDQSYGNAWFVNEIAWVKTADEEIKALDSLHKNKAVINEIYKKIIPENVGKIDSTASIQLEKYQPNQLIYKSKSNIPQITLFSEMYYPHGWKASIDGKEVEIFRANYVLRALVIPAGNHEIVFKFDPEIIRKGGTFSLISFIFFIVLIGIGIGYEFYKKKTTLKN